MSERSEVCGQVPSIEQSNLKTLALFASASFAGH